MADALSKMYVLSDLYQIEQIDEEILQAKYRRALLVRHIEQLREAIKPIEFTEEEKISLKILDDPSE